MEVDAEFLPSNYSPSPRTMFNMLYTQLQTEGSAMHHGQLRNIAQFMSITATILDPYGVTPVSGQAVDFVSADADSAARGRNNRGHKTYRVDPESGQLLFLGLCLG